ncbi:glycosyltransferase [Paenibacillus cremeus]|uniref:Glycosyltransferase n=1 Tax=Paenibacillus cremeus TaxID=2163881 RepID=A0A559K0G6_9BACL|nr:glycosyltransferase [Paenibacillus cremeus]TVY05645.1 glycosyltransferase [Paenibacillus cremeus]
MNPKVSIVVPIYNMENYLSRCLDSLLSQRLSDIEIIAVNDGSTDTSLQILQEYANRDKRLLIIEKQNGGVSSARNEGLSIARGQYIGFVDPDDWVDSEMYRALYETAVQEKADIAMCSYMREFGTHAKEKDFPLPDKVSYSGDEVQSKILRRLVGPLNEEISNPELLDAWGTVWSKLYRSEIIKENGVQFVDLSIVGTNEDSLFNIHTFYYAKSFVFLNRPYYHYWRVNTTSVTTGYKPDLINKWFTLYSTIERFLTEKRMLPEFHCALNNRICLNALGLGLNTVSLSNKVPFWRKISMLNSILNDSRIKHSFKHLEMKYFSIVWRLFYFCAKYRFAVGFYMMLVTMDRLRKIIR